MNEISTNTENYRSLRKDLLELIDKGRAKALQALAEIRTQTYWGMGQRLNQAREMGDSSQAGALIGALAKDLNLNSSVLYRALQFHQTYPDGLPARDDFRALPWSVHAELLAVRDPDQRAFYLQSAIENGWSSTAVRRALRSKLYEAKKSSGQASVTLERPRMPSHNYVAEIERVIDGDTLIVRIDLGFRTWRSETIRLRGIDSPELRTKAGKAARQFVLKRLQDIKRIVVHTYKTDVFARYVGDLFYDPHLADKDAIFEKGRFLNQEILDAGHAEVGHWG